MANFVGQLYLDEGKTDCGDSCCSYCSFIVMGKLYKFYNDCLFFRLKCVSIFIVLKLDVQMQSKVCQHPSSIAVYSHC